MRSSHALDRTEITFDDTHAVADAGVVSLYEEGSVVK